MLKKVFFYLAFLCLFVSPASAWDQAFEGHSYDMPLSTLNSINIGSFEHGYTMIGSGTSLSCNVQATYSGYLAYSVYSNAGGGYNCGTGVKFYDASGINPLFDSGTAASLSTLGWHRVEFIKSANGQAIEIYADGVYVNSKSFNNSLSSQVTQILFTTGCTAGNLHIDDLTTSSSHAIIGMDEVTSVTDSGQYYRLGAVPLSTGKYYQVRLYSPENHVVYTKDFTNATLLQEQLIPISNLSEVGQYTLHLYRVDSDSSKVFLTMKSFTVSDPAATGEGSISLDKAEYEAGDTVEVWAHLKTYAPGYKIVCEFPTSGTNFKKEISITGDTFHGSFTIPDISNVVGSHTVTLLNPSGKLVDSEDFNVYVPGLPDIAFDKSQYERTDKVNLYYKNAKPSSTISVILRYGGSTATTLSYTVSGNGVITLDLSSLSAADSIYANIKDSDGYTNDDDNAKIVVGNYVLTGRVYNAKTGEVVPGATVTVQGHSINSDASGNYNLTALAGFANYSVSATGYTGISGTVAVFDLETIHNFFLSPVLSNAGTGVYGTVVSAKTDYPLVGAAVEVTNSDNLKRFSTIVDNRGFYSLSNDDLAGNLTIRVSFTNYDSIVSTATVSASSMQNHNFRLNAVTGYQEIDPSEHTGGQDSDDTGETAEERAYREKYGDMGKHPFDFNGDGTVENSEWKYAFERLGLLIGCLAFMGFMVLISRRR